MTRPTAEGFAPLGLSHEKGTHRRTCQLLDQLGPEGRVGENGYCQPTQGHAELQETRKAASFYLVKNQIFRVVLTDFLETIYLFIIY